MSEFPPVVYVDLFQSEDDKQRGPKAARPQLWRWRAFNAGNFERLAVSSEAYTNRQDCIDAIEQLFGVGSNVYLREHEKGNQPLRMAYPSEVPSATVTVDEVDMSPGQTGTEPDDAQDGEQS